MNFGESESSLVDRDKSLVEGMLVTEKKEMALLAPLQNETTVVPATAGHLLWPATFAMYQPLCHVKVPASNGHLSNADS